MINLNSIRIKNDRLELINSNTKKIKRIVKKRKNYKRKRISNEICLDIIINLWTELKFNELKIKITSTLSRLVQIKQILRHELDYLKSISNNWKCAFINTHKYFSLGFGLKEATKSLVHIFDLLIIWCTIYNSHATLIPTVIPWYWLQSLTLSVEPG